MDLQLFVDEPHVELDGVIADAEFHGGSRVVVSGDQQLEVVARVAVQRREELVDVDVGQRLRDRDRLLGVVDLPRPAAAGRSSRRSLQSLALL